MVDQLDPHRMSDCRNLLRGIDIVFTRTAVARRMVVRHDHSTGLNSQSAAKQITQIQRHRTKSAFTKRCAAHTAPLFIQKNDVETLLVGRWGQNQASQVLDHAGQRLLLPFGSGSPQG